MTDFGRLKIEEAKKNGQWDKQKAPTVTEEQIAFLADLLKEHEPAYTNFLAMSPSIKLKIIPSQEELEALIGKEKRIVWNEVCTVIDAAYEMDRIWSDGGKRWKYEYKYRSGGKTLCEL